MKAIVDPVLRRLGIDPARYWLLTGLFAKLSERREVLTQLGRDGMALKTFALMYFVFVGFVSIMLAVKQMPVGAYFWTFLGITGFVMLMLLFSETGNSLVNPEEGLVLAHQPIDGATYTAAKLSHLGRIVLYMVPGINGLPAVAGVFLKGAPWFYPLAHMAAAFTLGVVVALLCCAVYGWLIRFVPARRLKAAGQVAEMLPWAALFFMQQLREWLAHVDFARRAPWLIEYRGYAMAAVAIAAVAVVVLGIRSLSGDYLVRVSAIARGGSARKSRARRSRLGEAVTRLFGGQPARAGFDFAGRMMLRDWQFRRQALPTLFMVFVPALSTFRLLHIDPFSERFSGAHLLPHVVGFVLFWVCILMPYGSDYKGARVFLSAPAGAFGGFARGVFALLWLKAVIVPHLAIAPVLVWLWGIRDAALFTAYSLALASLYLAVVLRLIDGFPFGRQPDTTKAPFTPMMFFGGAAVGGIVVAVQHFLLFRSPALVLLATAAVAPAAWFTARHSLGALEVAMRYHLGLLSGESKVLYTEVD